MATLLRNYGLNKAVFNETRREELRSDVGKKAKKKTPESGFVLFAVTGSGSAGSQEPGRTSKLQQDNEIKSSWTVAQALPAGLSSETKQGKRELQQWAINAPDRRTASKAAEQNKMAHAAAPENRGIFSLTIETQKSHICLEGQSYTYVFCGSIKIFFKSNTIYNAMTFCTN